MKPADLVQGRFEIEYRVASGGMGEIFRARDLASGDSVALKTMLGGPSTEALRFTQEIQLLAALQHPGIVRYVADGITDRGEPFLAMEWLHGEDLATRLERGPLEMHDALTLIGRIAGALAVAHERGIVHRDLKPGNLFLVNGRVDEVKLLDFGIAYITNSERLTHAGTILGTPAYMAPEQARNDDAIHATVDVFALGCILMECLTGTPVFMGEHVMAVLAKVLLQDAPRLHDIRPDLPQDLDLLLAKMMAKDPADRPPNGAAVVEALTGYDDWVTTHYERVSMLPASLTGEEQRVLSLVLVGKEPSADENAATLAMTATMDAQDDLRRMAEMHGARLTPMLDGSALVTFLGGDTVRADGGVDQLAQAARCALALRSVTPGRPIALATGRGEVKGKLPVGEVIDRAANLISNYGTLATSGAKPVAIDETSAHLLDTRFEIRKVGGNFILCGVRESGMRTLLGKPTSFVGRTVEIRVVDEHWNACIHDSIPGAMLVIGSAGMGKSRFLHEFLRVARQTTPEMEVWTGRGDVLAAGSALALLGHAIRDACGVQEGGPLDERHHKIHARVRRHVAPTDAERVAQFLGELVGAPFPAALGSPLEAARHDARLMGEQLLRAFEDFLDAESAARPILIVLEDLHWGDLPSVRFLDAAMRNLKMRPFLVLALGRPELEERFPKLWTDRAVQRVRLRPLPPKASEQLVTQVLGNQVDPEIRKRIVALADGNAFYLEELVRAAAEAQKSGQGDEAQLPDTVLAMVHARLEALPPETRRYLRAASVFGDVFFRGGLMALLGKTDESTGFDEMLEDLIARELILRQRQCRFAGDSEFMFRHALIREGAYAMLTESNRKLGHRLAGAWLEEHGESNAMLLAQHFERGEDGLRAASAYRRAAEHALEADDLEAAIERAERGIVCGAIGEELGALRLVQAEAHNWRGELARSEGRATEALELLSPGTVPWLRAIQQAADAAGKLGALDRVEGLVDRVIVATTSPEALNARTTCLSICANHLVYGGRYAAADTVISALNNTVDPATSSPQAAGMYHQMLAIRASASGDPWGFRDGHEKALPYFEQTGDRRNACLMRHNLGFGFAELGDYTEAEAMLRSLLPIAERMGLHEIVAGTLQNLARVLAFRGAFDEGRHIQKQAIEAFRQQEHPRAMGLSQAYLAELELLAGNLDIAAQQAQIAIDSLADVPPLRTGALAVFARILLARGQHQEALVIAQEAHALLETLGGIEEGETMVRLCYAEALAANQADDEFARAIASAREHLLAKANRIRDPRGRERFLTGIADNARTLELAARAK